MAAALTAISSLAIEIESSNAVEIALASQNEKFFDDNRKLTNLFPVGLIFFDTTKETLSTGIDLVLK